MLEHVKRAIEYLLFESGISNYEISKNTGIRTTTLGRYTTGIAKVGNMTLDNVTILYNYYLKIKEEGKVETKDRDMLFGRLFGVANALGQKVFEKGKQSVELRYMDRFKKKPIETFERIHADLMDYAAKFGPYENSLIDKFTEIIGELGDDSYTNDPLGDKFLLGLYKQRHELNNSKDGEENE